MKLKLTIALVCIAWIHLSFAQRPQIEFEQYKLKNGLNVILHQDRSTPIVTVSVLYHVGSKDEQENRTGFAHFFEHLLFEGSENIGRGEFMSILEGAGASFNAFTSFDQTYYYATLPSNQLELGLWMEAERMLHAKIDETGVETQRQVVKEELKQMYDNRPYGSILLETYKRAYSVHPYQNVPIGSPEDINSATLEEFMEFYEIFYVPENAVLTIAGDFEMQEAKRMVERYFGDIPSGNRTIPRPQAVEPPLAKVIRDTVYDNIQLPAVIQAYQMPAKTSADFYAVRMLTTLLSQGNSSRFHTELVERQQKAMAAGAFPIATEHPGLALMFGISNMGVDPMDLENAMEAEFEKVRTELISEREFERLRNQIENEYIGKMASVSGIAQYLSDYHVFYGDANLINTEIEKYMSVTREDIREAAQTYLTPDARVILYYLPKQN